MGHQCVKYYSIKIIMLGSYISKIKLSNYRKSDHKSYKLGGKNDHISSSNLGESINWQKKKCNWLQKQSFKKKETERFGLVIQNWMVMTFTINYYFSWFGIQNLSQPPGK